MDLKEIKRIYKFLRGTDIIDLELERDGAKLRIRRGQIDTGDVDIVQSGSHPPVTGAEPLTTQDKGNYIEVLSPMVGTFYRSPSPEAKPFVEAGDTVIKGQPLCIIEAMKLMNEIEVECDGKIISVLVDNGQPVEYGTALFRIEPL